MLKQYFKQAWNLMRQEKLFSGIYIVGTGLAVSMVMTLAIALTVMLSNVYPEMDRDRMLIVDYGLVEDETGQRFSDLSTQTIHQCFDGMKDVETLSIVSTWNELGKVQLDEGRQISSNIKYVDNNFWKIFSFKFIEGRPFTEEDCQARKPVAVISESLAKNTFGSTDVVGKDISFDFVKYRVAGVVKDASAITRLSYSDIWIPYTCSPYLDEEKNDPTGILGTFSAYLLVNEGADIHAVKQDGQQRIDRYSQSLGKDVRFWCMGRPNTYFESFFSKRTQFPVDYTDAIIIGSLIVLILLIIPAVNLSGMTDSRMERRMAELGVRRSFGASKGSLIQQIIFENLLFTFLGSIIGLFISYLLLYGVEDMLFNILDSDLPEEGHILLNSDMLFNPWIFIIVLTVCFVLNLCSALIPAWRASHHPITESLRPSVGTTMTEGSSINFFTRIKKNAWIGIELMLVFSLMWFITDYLSVMGFKRSLPSHMNTDRVWDITIGTLPENNPDYDAEAENRDRKRADFDLIIKAIGQYKDIEQYAALVTGTGMPFRGNTHGFSIINPHDTVHSFRSNLINVYTGTDYFRTFDFTDSEGNPVSMSDFNFDNPKNVVISQRLADYLFPDDNAVGKTIQHKNWDHRRETYHVVGVVGNIKRTDYERPENNIYTSDRLFFHQFLTNAISVRLKPGVSEQTFADRFMEDMAPKLRIGNFYVKDIKSYETVRDEINNWLGYTTLMSFGKMMSVFFLINIMLCVMGTFWYRVRMRREEIGVRMAMGADKKRIRNMLFKEGLALLTVAAVPAIVIALVLVITDTVAYNMPSMIIHPEYIIDYPAIRFVITNIMTWALLALAIVLAIWIPASRAVKLSPAEAIQDE